MNAQTAWQPQWEPHLITLSRMIVLQKRWGRQGKAYVHKLLYSHAQDEKQKRNGGLPFGATQVTDNSHLSSSTNEPLENMNNLYNNPPCKHSYPHYPYQAP